MSVPPDVWTQTAHQLPTGPSTRRAAYDLPLNMASKRIKKRK